MKSSTNRKSKESEAVLEVSAETHRRQLAAGLDPESLLAPGTHRFRRTKHVVKPDEPVAVNGKLRVTMYLDVDVIEFFRRRSDHYQTAINQALRLVVDRDRFTQELVSDEVIEKLADKVATTLKDRAA